MKILLRGSHSVLIYARGSFSPKKGAGPPEFFIDHTHCKGLRIEPWKLIFVTFFQAWRRRRKYAGLLDNTQPSTFGSTNEVFQLSIWCFWRLYENGEFLVRCRFLSSWVVLNHIARHMGGRLTKNQMSVYCVFSNSRSH